MAGFSRFRFTVKNRSVNIAGLIVFGGKKNKEEHRYYLLPGMGRANRRKHALWLRWAVVVGLIVSALFAVALYFMNRPFRGFR